jgi:hypothetical protein
MCRAIIALLLLAAAGQFVLRGPLTVRGHLSMYDFAMFLAAARVWVEGGNPYEVATLWPAWLSGGGQPTDMMQEYWTSVLPPSAFPLVAPLAVLPVAFAVWAWVVLLLGGVGVIIGSVLSLANLSGWRAWMFAAVAVAFAPVQALLMLGQTSLPTIALIFLSIERSRRGHHVLAGVLLGLGACFKPQLAVPFIAWFTIMRCWRPIAPALAVLLLFNVASIGWMQYHAHAWFVPWTENIAATRAPGLNDDPAMTGPWRHQMIHLPVMLFSVTDRHELVRGLSWGMSVALAAAFLLLLVRARRAGLPSRTTHLLLLATFSSLVLLPVYHKSYDAAMLLPALAWALREVGGPGRRFAIVVLVALSPFLVPFGFLELVTRRVGALESLAQTWGWRALIEPHHALATLATALCLLGTLWAWVRRAPRHQGVSQPVRSDPEGSPDDYEIEVAAD